MAQQLKLFKVELDGEIEKGIKKEVAIINILKRYISESRSVLFEGNGYSQEWVDEAAKRGLSNITTTPPALKSYLSPKSRALFVGNGIFNERELEARTEIYFEEYVKKVQIESRVIGDLAINHIIPTAVNYQNKLIVNAKGLKDLGLGEESYKASLDSIKEISERLNIIKTKSDEMVEARKVANNLEHSEEKAEAYCETVKPYFDLIRYQVDKLEFLVDDEDWPLPKYRELLFLR
jgi:glutamine synthetase